MRIEGNHDDGHLAPPALAPGRRATGALPTAGLAGTGSAGPTVPGPYSGDLTGAWWYTWTGFLLCVLVIAGFSAFGPLSHLREHLEAGRTEQVVALAVLLLLHVLGVAGQLHVARHFQAPPPEETEGPVFGRRDLAWLFGPTVPLALAGAVFPALGLTGTGTWWALPLWLSSLVLALLVHPCRRRPVLWGGLAASLVLGAAAVLQDPAGPADTAVGFLVWSVITACMIVPTVWFWRLMQRLDNARRQAADLAVTRERLRFAADLHDVQGHHLQVIALKAELAERLLAKGRTEDAGVSLHEVREQAREALAETRALVRDLREVSAERELVNAKEVLTAAGTATEVGTDPHLGPLGTVAGRLVAWLSARPPRTSCATPRPAAPASSSPRPARTPCAWSSSTTALPRQTPAPAAPGWRPWPSAPRPPAGP
ncbi:sensor histidine kinase [Micrococcus luteus]|uniref:sensor histidine kinase n=1 Tax=Micrococcus luteus TaxID=1270 RepID=UPI0033E153F1